MSGYVAQSCRWCRYLMPKSPPRCGAGGWEMSDMRCTEKNSCLYFAWSDHDVLEERDRIKRAREARR